MSKTFTSRPAVARTGNTNKSNRNQSTGTNPRANPANTNTRNPGAGAIPRTNPANINTRNLGAFPRANLNRGRGSSRGMMASGYGMGRGSSLDSGREAATRNSTENSDPQEQPQLGQQMSYQGGYTMITPNEKKKQQIQQQAERETQNYQRYKEQKKIGHMSYVGTAGGGELTQQEARNKLIQDNRNPSLRLREKREAYRVQQKKKEEDEINEMRQKQRQLTEKNKVRDNQKEADKRNKWDEDRKRKTDAFLNRIEGKKNTGQPPAESRVPPPHVSSAYQDTPTYMSDLPTASGGISQSRGVLSDIDTLCDMFPGYERLVLEDILQQSGSVENAISVLS